MTKREPSKKSTDKPPASRRKAEKPDLSHIAEGLRPLATPISKVKPDPKNARKHSDRNIAAIANSLARFGQVQPIVVNKLNSIVVAGNGRLTAAKSLEWTHIAVLYVELDPISQTGYALADNRTAEMAEWDEAMLAQAFEDIKAIDSALAHDLCIEEAEPGRRRSG